MTRQANMKRARRTTGKVSVAKRRKQFAAARPAPVAAGYQAGRELAGQPKQELKAFDVAHTVLVVQGIAGPPTFVTLNACVNGAELYNRVGRKIYMKSLRIRGVYVSTAANQEQANRIIVYYDSQPNAGPPLIATLLQDSNAAAATTWDSELNLTNRQRFQILRDYQVVIGDSAAAVGTLQLVPDPIKNSINVDFFIPLKGMESIYNGTNGGTVADITSGAIGIVAVGDTRTDTNVSFEFTSRLRYYD